MDDTRNILLVTNSATDEEISLVKNAFSDALQKKFEIKLSLVHVIPSLPTCYFNIPTMAKLAEQYYVEARECLAAAGDVLNVAKRDQWLITGRIKTEVMRLASKLGTQFILASSTSLHDLHQAFSLTKPEKTTQIKSFSHLAANL